MSEKSSTFALSNKNNDFMTKEQAKKWVGPHLMVYPENIIDKALAYMYAHNTMLLDIDYSKVKGESAADMAKRIAHFCRLAKAGKI